MAEIERWSGKDRGDENFPVGSALIRRSLRPHVHAYYAFARNADDIADDPQLAPADKIARLDAMQAVLLGNSTAHAPSATRLRASLAETGVDSAHATDLLIAFRQDAVKQRYADWEELMAYCRHSAMPVGRYLLDLHGEPASTHPGSNALCASLQVLNHVQDCASDLLTLDRCYIPQDMLRAHGAGLDDLGRPALTPRLRAVLDDLLERCMGLNATAASLSAACRTRGMRLESAVITGLARQLAARLRRSDPLAGRIRLKPLDFASAFLQGLAAW